MIADNGEDRSATKLARWRASMGGLALTVAMGCSGEEASGGTAAASKHWAPLAPSAVSRLYAGKTWKWKDGAAYFAADGRFKAWSRSGRELTEGLGTWTVREDGVMCFTATWATIPARPQQGSNPEVETCFSHQARGNAIAQMKWPDGPWYFFRRSPPRKTDELFKLRAGDHTRLAG